MAGALLPAGWLHRATMVQPNGQPGQIYAGATWIYNFETRDRLWNVTDPSSQHNSNGHTIDYTYDVANNKSTEQRANNQTVTYNTYDPMNRLTKLTVGQFPNANAITTYAWSNAGKMLSMVDPGGYIYSYAYDRLNRVVTKTYPLFNGTHPSESFLYDAAGNLSQFTNRNGNIQTFTYDTRNRETNYSWNDGSTPSRTLIYDDASRVTSCNSTSVSLSFTYFADGNLKSQDESTSYFGDNTNRTLNYTYNSDGSRASVSLPGLRALNYDYTKRNQLMTVTSGSNSVYATYGYDKDGNLTSRQLLNGINSAFAYDALNRLTDITHPLTGESKSFHYDYDAMGNRISAQRNGGSPDAFVYDNNSQLTKFTPAGGTAINYGLNASGDRTSVNTTN